MVILDHSVSALEENSHWGTGTLRVVGDITRLPFADSVFNGMSVSCHSFEHTSHPEKTFAELVRVMAPGGRAIIAAPDPKYDKTVARLVGCDRYYSKEMHQSIVSRERLGAMAEKSGLEVESLNPDRVHAAVVITFMAVLERLKLGVVFTSQNGFKETNLLSRYFIAGLWRGFRFLENHTPFRLLKSLFPFENILIARKT